MPVSGVKRNVGCEILRDIQRNPAIAGLQFPTLTDRRTRNRFRFGDGRIVVDLPQQSPDRSLPLLQALLEAL